MRRCIRVYHIHVQDAVRPLSPKLPDQKVTLLFRVYQLPRQVRGGVFLGQKGLPAPQGVTWVDEGVVEHVVGYVGLDDQV